MLFERLLIHRCTLIGNGKVTGRDPYGRDIIEKEEFYNVPCRFDQVRTVLSSDQYGNDFITRNIFFFSAEREILASMKINNIRDQEGKQVLNGSYNITDILPVYKGSKLHHYEVEVQKE